MRLEKIFRNPIIEAVEKGGLAPRECTFDFNDDGGCCITHAPSGSSFVLEGPFGHHTTTTVVGEGAPQQLEAFSWPTVEERVERWARDVKRDVDTPDLLAELQREREILTGTRYEEVENTPFSSEELAEIAEQLRQLKEHVETAFPLSEVQMVHLKAKLDDIAAAAGRMGRKDALDQRSFAGRFRPGDPSPRSRAPHHQDDNRRPGLPLRRSGNPAAAPAYDVASCSWVAVSCAQPLRTIKHAQGQR